MFVQKLQSKYGLQSIMSVVPRGALGDKLLGNVMLYRYGSMLDLHSLLNSERWQRLQCPGKGCNVLVCKAVTKEPTESQLCTNWKAISTYSPSCLWCPEGLLRRSPQAGSFCTGRAGCQLL